MLQRDAGGGRLNHCDCSQTAGFRRSTLGPQETKLLQSAISEASPCQVERGYHDMKNDFSLAPLKQALLWLKKCSNQGNSCFFWGWRKRDHHQDTHKKTTKTSQLSSWNKSRFSGSARQKMLRLPAVCHAALLHSLRCLLPLLLSAAQLSASCFHNSSGAAGWHSCSVGPHGLLKRQ